MPLLLIVIVVKMAILIGHRFKTSKKLFYINLIGYVVFLIAVSLIDYRIEIQAFMNKN